MSPRLSRRLALRSLSVAGCVGLAGCLSSLTSNASGVGCQKNKLPTPTQNSEGLKPREYPEYPNTITKDSATTFALEFEKAYRVNNFLAAGATGYDELHVSGDIVADGGVEKVKNGYIIGVEGQLQMADIHQPPNSTGTERPTGTDLFGAWYEITTRNARRVGEPRGIEKDDTPPDMAGATAICTQT